MNNQQSSLLITFAFCLISSTAYGDEGQLLALDANKGNCHSCHNIPGAGSSGNLGPVLSDIAIKYPDIKQLQAFLRDPALERPNTIMPPYGRHRILSEDEIIKVSKFIHKL